MLRIEDRLKLVNASAAFYRTSQQVGLSHPSAQTSHLNPVSLCLCLTQPSTCLQVCGVLESLEQEYRREEDWCGGGERQPEQLMPLINKHMEQKEAFLKVRRPRKTILNCFVSIAEHRRGQGCM